MSENSRSLRKNSVLLFLALCSACAPMWGGRTGRFASTNAVCEITAPVVARRIVTTPSWRYNLYDIPVPSRVAVGIEECSLPPGARVTITGMGYATGTKTVWNDGKQCGGDVPVQWIDNCVSGYSATEVAFPFTRSLPVVSSR